MEKSSSSLGYNCCLPEDIIQEILVQLPAKSLVRFKSVCKAWKVIITNPTFTKTQLDHSTTQHVSSSHIIVREDSTMFTLHLDLDNVHHKPSEEIKGKTVPISPRFKRTLEKKGLNVFGSCHGMLCVHVRDTNNIYLWNPSTNKSRLIPWPVSKAYKYCCKKLFGFGYVSSINDYKIVLVATYKLINSYYCPHMTTTLVHVYSLRENRWREIDRIATANSMKLPSLDEYFHYEDKYVETVLLNDALYWAVTKLAHVYNPFILKFDMVNEIFEKVVEFKEFYRGDDEEGRKWYWDYSLQHCIGAFGDNHKLCIYQTFNYCHSYRNTVDPKPDFVEMWVLDDHQCSWKKKFILEGRWDNLGNGHRLLKATGKGKVIIFERAVKFWKIVKHTRMENLLIFDWRRRKGLYIQVKNEYCLPYKSVEPVYDVINYVRTLISPNNILE